MRAAVFKTTQTPVLSVNGTAIPFPYEIVNTPDETRIQISANVSDTLLTDTSTAVVTIAWPFYDPTKWSTSITFPPPDAQFSVARVSDTSFVLSRINSLSFVPAGVTTKHCWTLIATDKPLSFGTDDCAPPPAAAPKHGAAPMPAPTPKPGPAPRHGQPLVPAPAKETPAKTQDSPAQPKATRIGRADEPAYSFLFTLPAKLPSKAVLVATEERSITSRYRIRQTRKTRRPRSRHCSNTTQHGSISLTRRAKCRTGWRLTGSHLSGESIPPIRKQTLQWRPLERPVTRQCMSRSPDPKLQSRGCSMSWSSIRRMLRLRRCRCGSPALYAATEETSNGHQENHEEDAATNGKHRKETQSRKQTRRRRQRRQSSLADLTDVFQRHGWSGLPQELSFSSDSGPGRTCDDGSIAQPKTIDCPDGTRKMVYACPGDDPTCDD